jgi:hypothetical protein
MKIFGIGLGKTGTTSLTKALEILGYSAIHGINIYELYGNASASTDNSTSVRYKELDILFPGSKFILTTRDLSEWLSSFEEHSNKLVIDSLEAYERFEYSWIRIKLFGKVEFDKELFAQGYTRHYHDVHEYFRNRQQDILVLNICGGEGWPKLCAFLNKPIPSVIFPNLNKR